MSEKEQLTQHFQRCSKCGRWEPIEYNKNEQKHQCPINKNMWVPVKFEDGKHKYKDSEPNGADLTLYDLMGQDTYVFARVKNKLVEVEVLDHDDERVFFEVTHPYAWDSLVSFARQVLQCHKRMEKDLDDV